MAPCAVTGTLGHSNQPQLAQSDSPFVSLLCQLNSSGQLLGIHTGSFCISRHDKPSVPGQAHQILNIPAASPSLSILSYLKICEVCLQERLLHPKLV